MSATRTAGTCAGSIFPTVHGQSGRAKTTGKFSTRSLSTDKLRWLRPILSTEPTPSQPRRRGVRFNRGLSRLLAAGANHAWSLPQERAIKGCIAGQARRGFGILMGNHSCNPVAHRLTRVSWRTSKRYLSNVAHRRAQRTEKSPAVVGYPVRTATLYALRALARGASQSWSLTSQRGG